MSTAKKRLQTDLPLEEEAERIDSSGLRFWLAQLAKRAKPARSGLFVVSTIRKESGRKATVDRQGRGDNLSSPASGVAANVPQVGAVADLRSEKLSAETKQRYENNF